MGIQTKLMNTIYIILTHKIDYFPVVSLINHYKKNQQQRQKEMKKKTQQLAQKSSEGAKGPSQREGAANVDGATGNLFGQNDTKKQTAGAPADLQFPVDQQISSASQPQNPAADASAQDPRYSEQKKVENLRALLDIDSQLFLLNLCIGVKDLKQRKKFSSQELEKIKEERVQMVILALQALNTFGLDEVESNFNILEFMSESVLPYLFDEDPQIRNEAV
jgi:hypothetical protein